MKRIQRWMPCIIVAVLCLSLLVCGVLRMFAAPFLKATFTPLEGDASAWNGITLAGNTGMMRKGVEFVLADGAVKTDVSLDKADWNELYLSNKGRVGTAWVIAEQNRTQAYQQADLVKDEYHTYLKTKADTVSPMAMVWLPDGRELQVATGAEVKLSRATTWNSGDMDFENPTQPISGFVTNYTYEGETADSPESQSFLQENQWLYRSSTACSVVLQAQDAYYFCINAGGPSGGAMLYRVDTALTQQEILEKTTETITVDGTQLDIRSNNIPYGSATKVWEQPAGSRILWAHVWGEDMFAMVVQNVVDGKQTVRVVLVDAQGNETDSAELPVEVGTASACQLQAFLRPEKNELSFTVMETIDTVDADSDEIAGDQVVRLYAASRIQNGRIEALITVSPDAENDRVFQEQRGFSTQTQKVFVGMNDDGTRLVCASESATEESVGCKYAYSENKETYFASDGLILEVYEPNGTKPIARGRLACGEKNNALLVSTHALPMTGDVKAAIGRGIIAPFARIAASHYTFDGVTEATASYGYYASDGEYIYFSY